MFFNSIFLTLLPALALAANDWTKPCTSGTCSYGSGDGKNTAWSSIVINAVSPDVLSDITSAAGWEILGCDSKSTDPQDIRLLCVDPAKGCSHLFNGGAEDTIVRLPENCSGGPFARVVRTWIDKDQSLPARLAKRGQTSGQVRGIALDFDFAQIPESKGKVYMTVAATNSPAQRDVIRSAELMKRSLQPIRHANRRAQIAAIVREFASPPIKRSPFSFGDAFKNVKDGIGNAADKVGDVADKVGDGIDKAADKVGDGIGKAVDTVGDGLDKAADKVGDGLDKAADKVGDGLDKAADKVGDVVKDAKNKVGEIIDSATGAVVGFVDAVGDNKFNKTFDKNFDPIIVNKSLSILDQSVDCPQAGVSGGLKIDADVNANVTANIGFILAGSLIPPAIDNLAFTGGLEGSASAIFSISVNAQGTLQSPTLKVFELGLPGLSFPGILSVGPSFSISAHADADLDIVADISLGASIDLSQMQFAFPASAGKGSANVKPKDSPLKLNVGDTDTTLTGTLTAHLVPRIDIGVIILNGAAKATVFADVDASAALDFTLNAQTTSTPVGGTEGNSTIDSENPQSSFGGSVGMNLGVSVNVGADAALRPFFETGANFELFQKTFPIFEKTFGDQPELEGDETEEELAEEEPTEEELSEDEPTEEELAEEEPTEEELAEEEPTEEELAEEEPAEEALAEEDPTEEELAEEEPTEEEPAEDEVAEDEPAEDELAEDEPADEAPADEVLAEEEQAEGQAEEQVGEEPTAEEPTELDPAEVGQPVSPAIVDPAGRIQAQRRSVLPLDNGRLSKRALVCGSGAAKSALTSIIDAVTTAPK